MARPQKLLQEKRRQQEYKSYLKRQGRQKTDQKKWTNNNWSRLFLCVHFSFVDF